MSKGIRFTDEFMQDTVAQVVECGHAISEVAERLGISTTTIVCGSSVTSEKRRSHSVLIRSRNAARDGTT